MNYAIIMAGGSGKRLWPLSRQNKPKQVLKLIDGRTLLRKCFERVQGIVEKRNILVLTNADYVDLVRDDLPELNLENIIAEPAMRDTASALGLAAAVLDQRDKEAVMAVVTADQLIEPIDVFQKTFAAALDFVQRRPEAMVTFGIRPVFPATQFGYIKWGPKVSDGGLPVYAVDSYKEKPDLQTAQQYLKDGSYYWNAGLFVWRAKTLLSNLLAWVPEDAEPLAQIQAAWSTLQQDAVLKEWFPRLKKISIDYAVMEKAQHVYGMELNCSWRDVGSFAALKEVIPSDAFGNTVIARHKQLLDSKDNIVITEDSGHLLAMIGVSNMIVVHTKDATLVCPADQTDRLKELLDTIQADGQESFL